MTPTRGNASYDYGYYGDVDSSPATASRRKKEGRRHRRAQPSSPSLPK